MTFRNTSARNPLRLFTEVLYIKGKHVVQWVGDSNSKLKSIIVGSMMWSIIPNMIGHIKINERVKKYPYNWILPHLHFVQYPIANDCLKVSIDFHSEPKLVPKLLPQVSVK